MAAQPQDSEAEGEHIVVTLDEHIVAIRLRVAELEAWHRDIDAEIRRLNETMNDLLGQLQSTVDQQRPTPHAETRRLNETNNDTIAQLLALRVQAQQLNTQLARDLRVQAQQLDISLVRALALRVQAAQIDTQLDAQDTLTLVGERRSRSRSRSR